MRRSYIRLPALHTARVQQTATPLRHRQGLRSRAVSLPPSSSRSVQRSDQTHSLEAGMSALGQKQTFALHQPMSALPPIATSIAFFGMSAMGQKRTSAIKLQSCPNCFATGAFELEFK